MLKKLKEKKAVVTTSEYVIYFLVIMGMLLIMIQLGVALFASYDVNVAATNVSRIVSSNGGTDIDINNEIYSLVETELGNRAVDGTIVINIYDEDKNLISQTTSDLKSDTCEIQLGDAFYTTISSKVIIGSVFGKNIELDISSSASGIGGVYHK